ncbi:DUF3995 domain-containing protein [Ekhidna sp.]|uniref:DUF3995 domain-containing protein n=1 Tax=Ekhidna sp. TaxID=2608089 RepID=UPI003299E4DC
MIATIILVSTFLVLSLIHFSWALGSRKWHDEAIPKTEAGDWVIKPGKKDSLIVGLGLLFFGIFYLIKVEMIDFQLPEWAMDIASWLIPFIFLFRAIGDFKYVGFFKKITTTQFAKKDSQIYSPLCLTISIIGFIIELF